MHTPKVSVLVTVYNREDYLSETLSSILASTFDDLDVIVVDDNSRDSSFAIASQFAQKDNRVQLFRNNSNFGDYKNRQRAVSLAKGQYIKFVDSDDLIYPHSLAIMVEALDQFPDAALALQHSESDAEEPYPWKLSPYEAYHKHFLGRGCMSCGPTGAIMRRKCYENVGGFDPSWKVLADIDLWLRLSAKYPLVLMPPGLVWWRRHNAQEYSAGDASMTYLTQGLKLAITHLGNEFLPLEKAETEQALARARVNFCRAALGFARRNGRFSEIFRSLRENRITPQEFARALKGYV